MTVLENPYADANAFAIAKTPRLWAAMEMMAAVRLQWTPPDMHTLQAIPSPTIFHESANAGSVLSSTDRATIENQPPAAAGGSDSAYF